MSTVLQFRKGEVHQVIRQLPFAGFILYPRWNSTAESDTDHYIPHSPNYSGFTVKKLAYAK